MNNMIVLLIIGLGVLIPIIVSIGALRKFFISLRVPTTWISALPGQGWVEVLGRIRGEPIKSPFKKLDCAYWQLEIQEYQNRGRGGGSWTTIRRELSGPFIIDDMTGRIEVQDGKATMVTNNQTVTDASNPDLLNFLEDQGIKTTGFLGFHKKLRLHERRVAPDEEILVLGRLQKSMAPVTISGNYLVPLVISNQGRSAMNKALLIQAIQPVAISLLVVISIAGFYFLTNMR
jgi:hypothetical protein